MSTPIEGDAGRQDQFTAPSVGSDAIDRIRAMAEEAGIRRVHLMAWRDLDDAEAGGSEVHAHEVERRWAAAGLDVTHRTSFAVGEPPERIRDGYRVVRRGNRYLCFPRTIAAELSGRMGPKDALVEIWNGVPFLSPLWFRGPSVVCLHHIHREMWQMMLPGPIAKAGNVLEERIGPRLYRRSHMVTLSPSSQAEMLELGFRRVDVIPPGLDARFSPADPADANAADAPVPTVVAVGRLAPVKRFDALIDLAQAVKAEVPDLRLVIVGHGAMEAELRERIVRHGATEWIRLTGRISDAEVVELYRSAWAVASVSAREGWGLTLTEAAACGTPAVATRIPGHLDAVAEGTSGLLADDDAGVADALVRLLTDAPLRRGLSAGALAHAAAFTWDNTAIRLFEALAEEARRLRDRP